MAGDVERGRFGDHLERALNDLMRGASGLGIALA